MANEILGPLSYLNMYQESTWNTKPTSPNYVFVPCTEYGVKLAAEQRAANPYVGQFDKKHLKNFRGMPAGSLVCPLFAHHVNWSGGTGVDGSLAEFLLKGAFDNATSAWLPSWGAQWAEGPDTANREHNGLRVNGCTITGSEDVGAVIATLDLMGGSEAALGSAQTLPTDFETLPEFEFATMTMTIDSTTTELSSFTLQIQNGLKPKYRNNRTPDLLPRTTRAITFSCELVKNSDTYHAALRALATTTEYDITLNFVAPHNGTGADSNTTLQIDLLRCALTDPSDAMGIEDMTMTTLNTTVLKPEGTTATAVLTWGTS